MLGSSGGGGGNVRECHQTGGPSSSPYPQNHPMNTSTNNISTFLPQAAFPPELPRPIPAVAAAYEEVELPGRDERSVPWGTVETKELIAARTELEGKFAAARRNKALWELVAERMNQLGFRRTPDQCKCKWKHLVVRYKGMETSDLEDANHFPFYDELHAFFTGKGNYTHLPRVNFEGGYMPLPKAELVNGDERSLDLVENDYVDVEGGEDGVSKTGTSKKRKAVEEKGKQPQTALSGNSPGESHSVNPLNSESPLGGVPEMLRDFFQQQQRIEMQWRESMEKFAKEREVFENDWQQAMVRLERERIMMEQAWREKEEERKAREESRAEKRDALLTALLNELIQDKDTYGNFGAY